MAEAWPQSQNADIQTDHMEEYPKLFQDPANKQGRINEKKPPHVVYKKIEKHMAELNSRTELTYMRRDLTNQLEECIKDHNIFQSSPTWREKADNDWVGNLERITTNWYGQTDN